VAPDDTIPLDEAPNRLWRVVMQSVDDGRPPTRHPKRRFQARAQRFLKRWRRTSAGRMDLLKDEYPDVYPAWALQRDNTSVKWILEAGLLTDVSYEELGHFIGYPTKVVESYERLFFAVRGRLEHRGYILSRVVLPACAAGLHQRDSDFLFKALAYCGGWAVLRDFLDIKELSPETESWLNETFRARLKKLGWLAAYRLEPNQFNAVEIIDKYLSMQELEHQRGGAAGQGQVDEAMKSLFSDRTLTIMKLNAPGVADERRALQLPPETYVPTRSVERENGNGDGEAE
jgi:hypothetical protein